ncbi:transposase [Bradyrhizobium sp. 62B]|uniref:IS66 family transposase n=1 Tax=Bradyrhizobium sp. 62B TaxID=2898442 RepID=UPI0035E3821A
MSRQRGLQVDGYIGYPKLAERGEVELTFCRVHMPRNLYELATAGPLRSRARC